MSVALFSHADCVAHEPGPHHPESPARLGAVLAALDDPGFAGLVRREAPLAERAQVERAHPPDYVAAILAVQPEPGDFVAIDADTLMSAGSATAALRAAGGAVAAVDAVQGGEVKAAFVATRPPGHHAERATAMGFCLFNNAAVAAYHARARWGQRRVAVVDFDVHHGNGTQAIFWDDADLFYGSSHQSPCYPGTGAVRETGVAGNVVNAPLRPNSDGGVFRAAWRERILPALDRFAPELLIISAGFDAHRADPLAQLRLDTVDFAWITRELCAVAGRHCGGRVVSLLEGGYDLGALAASAAAHVAALMDA